MASLGKIEEFNPKNTNILHYLERLEQYFKANEVARDSATSHRRSAILISVIGGKTYDILADLCSPASPTTKSFAELTATLKKQFAPKKLVISERYRFHTSVQAGNQTVSEFAAQLQRLASTCNYGAHLNEALWNRFVCGLRRTTIQKRLLTEEVDFDQAMKIALGQEAAENDLAQLNGQADDSNKVNKLHNGHGKQRPPKPPSKSPGKEQTPTGKTQTCLSCGKTGHPRSNCKFRNSTCFSCGKVGHIGEACRRKPTKVHTVEGSPVCDDSVDPFSISLYTISSDQHGIEVPIELNSKSVLMELDTGVGISIISEETYKRLFNEVPLVPSTTKLHAYTGDPIRVCGQLTVNVNITRVKVQTSPSPWSKVREHPSWGEIGSLKFVLIGNKFSVYVSPRVHCHRKLANSCTLRFKVTQIFSRMNLAQSRGLLPNWR